MHVKRKISNDRQRWGVNKKVDYYKSYQLYLKKIDEQREKKVVLPNGREKKVGIKFLEPISYPEFKIVYPVIKEYTGGKNVLREIVNQSRVTSTAQAKAAWNIYQKINKKKLNDNADEEGKKNLTRGDFNRMSEEEIKEFFKNAYKTFKKEQNSANNGAEKEESEDAEAWQKWKIIRGISP